MQDIDVGEIQRILQASKQAAKIDAKAFKPISNRAVVQLDRSVKNWQHPKHEESAERKPLFDAGLALIAEVRQTQRHMLRGCFHPDFCLGGDKYPGRHADALSAQTLPQD